MICTCFFLPTSNSFFWIIWRFVSFFSPDISAYIVSFFKRFKLFKSKRSMYCRMYSTWVYETLKEVPAKASSSITAAFKHIPFLVTKKMLYCYGLKWANIWPTYCLSFNFFFLFFLHQILSLKLNKGLFSPSLGLHMMIWCVFFIIKALCV